MPTSSFPTPPPSAELLDRYLAGDCTPAERSAVEAELTARPALRDLAALAGGAAADSERLWRRFAEQRLTAAENPSALGRRSAKSMPAVVSRYRYGIWLGIAGALVLAAGMGTVLNHQKTSQREFATMHAERRTVEFPGGSRAILAPDSRLRYTQQRNGTLHVALDGQAFFTVTHRANQAFVVQSGAATTHVLGTAFEVRHYPGDALAQVSVVTGKVSVRVQGTPVILTPGMTSLASDSAITVTTDADVANAVAWTNGRLVFKDTPVPTVLRTLSRWYGYSFRVADSSLAREGLTTMLPTDSAAQVFKVLQSLLDVTVSVEDSVVTLHPRSRVYREHAPGIRREREVGSRSFEVGK